MNNKRIVILGSGESGCGAAVLASKQGFSCFVSDFGIIQNKYKEILENHNIDYEEGKHSLEKILNADEIVKSPGIPDNIKILDEARNKNIPIISEIEFAGRYTNAIKICITGSNGKTTTTLLTYHILKKAGLNVGIAGNVGQSFAYQVATENYDYYVLELSSFQLDSMTAFKSEIAVLLNITPDHLDRYEYKFQNYIDSKFRILQNQTNKDSFIYCSDDETIIKEIRNRKINAEQFQFSQKSEKIDNGAYTENNKIIFTNQNRQDMVIETDDLTIQGKHNVYNTMASGIIAHILDIRKETIRDSLMDFKNIEHRLEPVVSVHGISFINDSKATNVNSAWYALECTKEPIIWIAGGVDKGNDYSILEEMVQQKVKAIICLGKDNAKIKKAFKDKVERIIETDSMPEAVKTAYYLGKKGDTVLLSPACASFDLFDNYEDRGHQFKQCVRAL